MRRACIILAFAPFACDDGPGEADEGARPAEIVFEPDAPDDQGDADTGAGNDTDPAPSFGVAPTCRIVTPAEGSTFQTESPIHFSADLFDEDGDISTVLWSSNVWGAMVLGPVFDFELPASKHEVTLRVTDEAGHICIDRVVIVVVP